MVSLARHSTFSAPYAFPCSPPSPPEAEDCIVHVLANYNSRHVKAFEKGAFRSISRLVRALLRCPLLRPQQLGPSRSGRQGPAGGARLVNEADDQGGAVESAVLKLL